MGVLSDHTSCMSSITFFSISCGMNGSPSGTASPKSSPEPISLKSYFQSVLMVDSLSNVGMKLYSSLNNSLFDSVKFDLDNNNNRVEILYASPY